MLHALPRARLNQGVRTLTAALAEQFSKRELLTSPGQRSGHFALGLREDQPDRGPGSLKAASTSANSTASYLAGDLGY